MEYTILKLARLAGVSTRTLRYYDQTGLLKPARANDSGYRVYGAAEVDRLQQILFYRELGLGLREIGKLLDDPDWDRRAALRHHLDRLTAQKRRVSKLIATVRKTIASEEGGRKMMDQQKFEGFKQQLVRENERKYGAEARGKYGGQTIDASNAKMMGLSERQYAQMQKLADEIGAALERLAGEAADPKGPQGKKITQLHKEWLGYTWAEYSPQAHAGLAQMYVDDARFTAYYDKNVRGCAAFLKGAVAHWAGKI